ncbi:MAG: HTH-type transcriptional regulator BhcR [Pseudomonadota bacterium]
MASEIDFKKTRGRPRNTGSGKSTSTVQALDRALELLKLLAEIDEANLTELALRSGMAPSTAHRLLVTLQQQGIVEFDDGTQNWMVGVDAFRIGSSFVRRTRVVDAGRPVMRELMLATGETANMARADDGDVVFLSQVETHEAIRAFFRPGTRGAMHASGIGKALLAEMPRRQVEHILQGKGLETFTAKTLSSPADLFADLETTRARGWSIDDEERNVGMRCIAAPIFNAYGEAVAGISISGPTVRVTDEKLMEFGPLLKRAAAKVTKAIGGESPARNAESRSD